MIAALWEWGVAQAERCNPVGVCMTQDAAMTALCRALEEAGRPGRGSLRKILLVNEARSEAHYLRFPVIRTAVYDQGAIRWERPAQRGRQQFHSGAVARGRQALCHV
jgi:hypothetical protein